MNISKEQKALLYSVVCYEDALRRGLLTPEEAFGGFLFELHRAHAAYLNGEGGKIDRRMALNRMFTMLARVTKP